MLGFGAKKKAGRLGDVRFFIIYYGPSGEEAKQRIRSADLAIVELRQWLPEELAEIRRAGVRIFGYWSVMETADWDRKKVSSVASSDMLTAGDGSPIRFAEWNSTLMDLRSPGYRSLLLAELDAMLEKYGPDGVFVDTAGDIEDYVPPALRPGMTEAYHSLLAVAKSRFPYLQWIQNRGFSLLDACEGLLDGFLWEGFDAGSLSTEWSKEKLGVLRRHRYLGLSVLTVNGEDDPRHRVAAKRHGFIHWTSAGGDYLRL